MSRIGIYAGSFNPVHSGHIAFALQALTAAKLDQVYFLPERRPRNKAVEHFGHRVAMLERALRPHRQFNVLEMVEVSFSVDHTLPRLSERFFGDDLVFLFGSDVVIDLINWPKAERLLKDAEIVVGLRAGADLASVKQTIEDWPIQPKLVTVFESFAPDVSSGKVRQALRSRLPAKGLLKSVEQYSNKNWLYISLQ